MSKYFRIIFTLIVFILFFCIGCNHKYLIKKVEIFPENQNITDNEKKLISYKENDYIKYLPRLLDALVERNLFENDTLFLYSIDQDDAYHLWNVLIKKGQEYFQYFFETDTLIQKKNTGKFPLDWGVNPNYLNDIYKNKFNIIQQNVNKQQSVWPVDFAIKIEKKQEIMEVTLYFITWCKYQFPSSYRKELEQ